MENRVNINKVIISDTLLEMSKIGGIVPDEYSCYHIADGLYQVKSFFGWIKYRLKGRKKYKIIIK